jgi:methanesulfonate monooxygenase small subunit
MSADKDIAELVYQSCFLLDEMNFSGYLDLCAPEFRYRIVAYSPELRKEMVWQDVDREELQHHFELIPKHVREMVSLSRFPTLYSIRYENDGKRAAVRSGLQVFKTKLDGGETKLYGVCRLHDVVDLGSGRPLLLSREVRMETRQLGTGSQIPF